jgi:hypothetical protein
VSVAATNPVWHYSHSENDSDEQASPSQEAKESAGRAEVYNRMRGGREVSAKLDLDYVEDIMDIVEEQEPERKEGRSFPLANVPGYHGPAFHSYRRSDVNEMISLPVSHSQNPRGTERSPLPASIHHPRPSLHQLTTPSSAFISPSTAEKTPAARGISTVEMQLEERKDPHVPS